MSTFVDFYVNLLIKQYWEKTNAKAEITFKAEIAEAFKNFLDEFGNAFDLDLADSDRLDKIGKLVGQSRVVPFTKAKSLFGFSINPNAKGFSSKFDNTRISAPFSSKFQPIYTDSVLNDYDYRTLIKAKIALNVCHAVMSSDGTYLSISDVIYTLFNGSAYVVDNKDMTLSLYLPFDFDIERLRMIVNANLLPSGQGVRYKLFIRADALSSFGFSNNVNTKGFASKFDPNRIGGKLARKVIL